MKLKELFIFATGALAGTFIGARISKKHYSELAEEEINDIRDYYKNKLENTNVKNQETEEVEELLEKTEKVEDKQEYDKIIKIGNYMTIDDETDEEDKEDEENDQHEELSSINDEPYVINPEDFGKDGYYATQTLTYFADGILVDDVDEVVEQAECLVGTHHIDIFRDFDATSVYIRNDWAMTDFEILKDDWFWSDIEKSNSVETESYKKPHEI